MPPALALPVHFSPRHRSMFQGAGLSAVFSWEHPAGSLTSSGTHGHSAPWAGPSCAGSWPQPPMLHVLLPTLPVGPACPALGSLACYPGLTFYSPQEDVLLTLSSPDPTARRLCGILCFPLSACKDGLLTYSSILYPMPTPVPGKC